MNTLFSRHSVMAVISLFCANTVAAQAVSVGSWEVNITTSGIPGGDSKSTKKLCVTAAQTAQIEKAFLDVSVGKGERGPQNCELKNLVRAGNKASWKGACDGPRGSLETAGTSTVNASAVELEQSFAVEMPLGSLQIKQAIKAKRLGDC
jgi:Protein of unknown function (DUF3617)